MAAGLPAAASAGAASAGDSPSVAARAAALTRRATGAGWGRRAAHLALAPVLTLGAIGAVAVLRGGEVAAALVAAGAASLTGPGKFMVIAPLEAFHITTWEMAAVIAWMDSATALWLTYNLDLLYALPRFGRKIRELVLFSEYVVAHNRWMRRFSFVGVVAFVAFPISGTGAVGGTLLGRMLGMRPWVIVLGIVIGAVVSCFGVAAAYDQLVSLGGPDISRSWWFVTANVAGIAVILFLLVLWARRMRRTYLSEKAAGNLDFLKNE
ncbi:MAG: small multi-drug export protein [Planctomycetes bacterium]|nr:small multi-drug export protein [Planctomycetota bacterium]